jgi:hypothetical protein
LSVIVNLDKYRKKKSNSKSVVYIPVFKQIFIENNKLIGQFESGKKVVIEDFNKGE